MAGEFLQVQQDNTLGCSQKLDEIQSLIRNIEHPPPGSLHYVSNILDDCTHHEHSKCLETAYLISKEETIVSSSGLGHGLEAIGAHDIHAVNQFINRKIQVKGLKIAYALAALVPYLYRDQENEMANQMSDWYATYKCFFFYALENTLECFLEESSGHGGTDFTAEIQPIKDELESIARREGLEPDNAYQDKDYEIVEVSILLSDLKWDEKNTVHWKTIESNLSQYTHLAALLRLNNSDPIYDLQQHNTHPLINLLKLDHSDNLTYYNHCIELIAPGKGQASDPTTRLRDDLLARNSFESTIAEMEVFNALRRECGTRNAGIEQKAPNGGRPDAKITTGGKTIWVEVTLPQPQPSYEIGRHYVASMSPKESDARTNVVKKLRSQIRDLKDATGDLTMLVIKNEESRVDNEIVKDYVEGHTEIAISEDDDDADPIIFVAEPGLEYNNVADHLDILVNYNTFTDLSNPPYIEGQVANLTNVDQGIIDHLIDAFNAEELTPS